MPGDVYHGPVSSSFDDKVEPGYPGLIRIACVKFGFCGRIRNGQLVEVDGLLPKSGDITAREWVELLFRADGVDLEGSPEKYERLADQIEWAFIDQMGTDKIDVAQIHALWDDES